MLTRELSYATHHIHYHDKVTLMDSCVCRESNPNCLFSSDCVTFSSPVFKHYVTGGHHVTSGVKILTFVIYHHKNSIAEPNHFTYFML